ncbi:MAG: deoxyribodipyrimidine photo-lyase [Cyanobacteria bacterium J06642_2]
MNRTIVWFRRDLRVSDHLPLLRAARRGAVIPVFILDNSLLHHPETGSARVAFMLDCLRALDRDLHKLGGRLILRSGDPVRILPDLIRSSQADGIYAHTDCERIYGRSRDARLNRALQDNSLRIRWFEPAASRDRLTAYPTYRNWWFAKMNEETIPTPARVDVPTDIASVPLPKLSDIDWAPDGKLVPAGGTAAARKALQRFCDRNLERYYWQLSYPAAEATSGLSPYLKFGAISVRECYQTVKPLQRSPDLRVRRSAKQLISRLRWGSGFAQRFRYLPQLEVRSLYTVFDEDGWSFDEELYRAWQEGRTGFPIVDAAARCLLATGGWQQLNFRIRAIYASFLANLLGMDWRYGALHFMRHLIDGDCPIDHYQWAMQAGVTHCIDKSWTRIYHPGQLAINRCDPNGAFIKRWVPELAELSPAQLGEPPAMETYPAPILDYKTARARRVAILQRQRNMFRQQSALRLHLARMPECALPFGRDRVTCDVKWATSPVEALFPVALDLESLSACEVANLRTWFVAHVSIPAWRSNRGKRQQPDEYAKQLNLI